ncbi:MAG: DNA polymerase III subunit gamma/tau, partial [Flavobacteriaceae bacterium]
DGAMRDALSIFDRVVSFSGNELTRKAVTENLNVLDYDTYFETTDLILEHDIPRLLLSFNATLAKGFEGHHFIVGLASHFRDLLVCKHENTVALLEVGENAQKRYLEQSKKTSEQFLLKAIDIANTCDLNYKTSKNHRLLVELALMKLASINFDAQKKNPDSLNEELISLIPASHFKQSTPLVPQKITITKPTPAVVGVPIEESQLQTPQTQEEPLEKEELPVEPLSEEILVSEPPKKIRIQERTKRVSGLSLSSLKAKKEHQNTKKENEIDESSLPVEPFTVEDMQQHWADFVQKLDKEGRKILASNLNADLPKLQDDTTIAIELPNGTMKKEIEREQHGLMMYLKKKLNNYAINLKITVNEETAKKYAFTPEEKYQKLREKNPAIDLLRKTFDLDL